MAVQLIITVGDFSRKKNSQQNSHLGRSDDRLVWNSGYVSATKEASLLKSSDNYLPS